MVEVYGVKIRVRNTPQARATETYIPRDGYDKPYDGFDARHVCEGNSNCIPLCPNGAKYDAGVHLRAASQNNGEFNMLTGSVVTQILKDAQGRVTTVEYKNWRAKDKDNVEKANANVIILAANAIESAKILLLSDLANSSDQVGRNLMDHLQDEVTALFPVELFPFRGPQSTCSIEDFRDGLFRNDHSAIRMTIGNDGHARARSPIDVLDEQLDNKIFGDELRKKIAGDIPRMLRIGFSTEMLPDPNNRITLSDKKDEYGLQRPRITFSAAPYTYDGLKKGHEIAIELLDGIPNIDKTTIKEREWIRKWNTAAHIMGTCRMGNDPGTSVVNANGRTHDHENLYIVGSSVFTTSGTANPTLTAAALALKTTYAVLGKI
jgi:choline dehydrogenase-like flavoprotein